MTDYLVTLVVVADGYEEAQQAAEDMAGLSPHSVYIESVEELSS